VTIPIPAPLQRLANFLKSVWPADRGLVALLLGSLLLLMAQGLGSWSLWVRALLDVSSPDSRFVGIEAASFLNLTMYVIYFAGAAALYVCLLPGQNPSKQLTRWVYFPLVIGLAANVATVLYLARSYSSVPLPDGEPLSWTLDGFARLAHALGSGIWSTVFGAVLVLYGDLRLRAGSAQLPIHFAPEFSSCSGDAVENRQVDRFVWMMIALSILIAFAGFPAFYFPSWIHGVMGHEAPGWKLSWSLNYINVQIWLALALFVLVYAAMGSSRRETLKQSLFALWVLIDVLLFRLWPPDREVGLTPEPLPEDPPQHLPQFLDSPT